MTWALSARFFTKVAWFLKSIWLDPPMQLSTLRELHAKEKFIQNKMQERMKLTEDAYKKGSVDLPRIEVMQLYNNPIMCMQYITFPHTYAAFYCLWDSTKREFVQSKFPVGTWPAEDPAWNSPNFRGRLFLGHKRYTYWGTWYQFFMFLFCTKNNTVTNVKETLKLWSFKLFKLKKFHSLATI